MGSSDFEWDPEAEEKISELPAFIQGMAKGKAEEAAAALGETRITVELLEKVRKEAMGG